MPIPRKRNYPGLNKLYGHRLRARCPHTGMMLSANGISLYPPDYPFLWLGRQSQFQTLIERSQGEKRRMLEELVLVYAEDTEVVYDKRGG